MRIGGTCMSSVKKSVATTGDSKDANDRLVR